MNPFYQIPEDAWLFRGSARDRAATDRRWKTPEEEIRQWCLHELIRTYGISVCDLEIERPIRVARERRSHRADIVVLQDGKPHVVVECKSARVRNLDAAMHQATNYAELTDVRAPFAACTNGNAWLVRRRIGYAWVAVADIPDFHRPTQNTEWRQILLSVKHISPVLHWLDKTVPAKYAPKYFDALQRFFYGRNDITVATDHHLLWAADNLLRVLSDASNRGYSDGKMAAACDGLTKFWKSKGVAIDFSGKDQWDMAHYGYASLTAQLEDGRQSEGIDLAALRLILSLLGYLNGVKSGRRVRYTDVEATVQREVRGYVAVSLLVRFNASLPDPVDEMLVGDIQRFCQPAWKHFGDSWGLWLQILGWRSTWEST